MLFATADLFEALSFGLVFRFLKPAAELRLSDHNEGRRDFGKLGFDLQLAIRPAVTRLPVEIRVDRKLERCGGGQIWRRDQIAALPNGCVAADDFEIETD